MDISIIDLFVEQLFNSYLCALVDIVVFYNSIIELRGGYNIFICIPIYKKKLISIIINNITKEISFRNTPNAFLSPRSLVILIFAIHLDKETFHVKSLDFYIVYQLHHFLILILVFIIFYLEG